MRYRQTSMTADSVTPSARRWRALVTPLLAVLVALASLLAVPGPAADAEPLSACGIGARVDVHDRHRIAAEGASSCGDTADLAATLKVCLDRWGSDGFTALRCRSVDSEAGADEVSARVGSTCRDGAYRAMVYAIQDDGTVSRGWSSTALVNCHGRGDEATRTWACFTFAFPPSGGAHRIGDVDAVLGCQRSGADIRALRVRACIQRHTDAGWSAVTCDSASSRDELAVSVDLSTRCRPGEYRTVAHSSVRTAGGRHEAVFTSPATQHLCQR